MAMVLARQVAHSKLYPAVLAFSLLAPAPAWSGELSKQEVTTYRNAISAAARGRSAEAVHDVRRTQNEVAKDVVQWFALQQGSLPAGFATYAEFIRTHANWPRCIEIKNELQCDLLRKQAELRLTGAEKPAEVIGFFSQNAPLSPKGLDAYAAALRQTGQTDTAREAIKSFWVKGSMPRSEQDAFFSRYSADLTESDREARVDRLLWDGATESAKALIPTLSSHGYRAVAQARIALQDDAGNAASLVDAVPDSHKNDDGLIYDRASRLAKKDNEQAAARLLFEHGPATNGKPNAWWKLRDRVARALLKDGESSIAYRIVSQHGLSARDEQPYRDAEWMAGWIALRFRGDAQTASTHFKAMYEASTSVISKARGAYWLGRSVTAQGNEATADDWYKSAAQYGTTYYGQLAAHELFGNVNISAPSAPPPSASARSAFNRSDLTRAVRVGVEIGNHSVAKAFMHALADSSKTQDEATLAVLLGNELRRPDLAAWAGKRVGRLGFDVPVEGYPVLHFTIPSQPEAPLIHAVTRQESTFYQYAQSKAGAMGMMQLLPATASEQAKKMGIPHQQAWLTSKPEHNVRIGSSYLNSIIERNGGSYIAGIAGYNAGPARPSRWREDYGDPSRLIIPNAAKPGEPALWSRIDWVELIPFAETREYVQFVLSGTEVYRAILNAKSDRPAHLQLRNNLMR